MADVYEDCHSMRLIHFQHHSFRRRTASSNIIKKDASLKRGKKHLAQAQILLRDQTGDSGPLP